MFHDKTIKFFVSSTFLDFKKERNALQRFVFPRLKTMCLSHGFNFQPVDLRWGVSNEVVENNQALDFCLNEVGRCSNDPQPSLLVLMGQRYGWIPIPTKISKDVFDTIYSRSDPKSSGLLLDWYTLDTNEIYPSYFLNEKSGFNNWSAIEDELRAIFINAQNKGLCTGQNFNQSATEREIRYALKLNELSSILYERSFHAEDEHEEFISKVASESSSLTKLKQYLKDEAKAQILTQDISIDAYLKIEDDWLNDNERFYDADIYPEDISDYIREFCENIFSIFAQKITNEIKSFQLKTPLQVELAEQANIKERKSSIIEGRENIAGEILDYINTENDAPFFLLHGPSGMGKSSAIAHTIKMLEAKENINVIYRFMGFTELSGTIISSLESIAEEVSTSSLTKFKEVDKEAFFNRFSNLLMHENTNKKTVIFLDGLDQSQEFDENAKMLLMSLSGRVKLVVSVVSPIKVDDTGDYPYFEALKHTTHKIRICPLENEEITRVIQRTLAITNRTLSSSQLKVLNSTCTNKSPLFINLACKIARHWKSHQNYTIDDLGLSESDLIKQFFNNVITNSYHKRAIVENVLGLISASKMGLSELEIMSLLSEQNELLNIYNNDSLSSPKLTRLPDAFFSRLYFDIREFFLERKVDGEILIYPAHHIISETINIEFYQKHSKQLHRTLIKHFSSAENVKRKAREITWNQFCLKDVDALFSTLLDVDILTTVFSLYTDGIELQKYFTLVKPSYPDFITNVVDKYVSQSTTSHIDENTVVFFDTMRFLGQVSIPKLGKLIDEAVSFQNDNVFYKIKYHYLGAKVYTGREDYCLEVLDELSKLLSKIPADNDAFFLCNFLLIQTYKTLGNYPKTIDLCNAWLDEKSEMNEDNIQIHAYLASTYKHNKEFDNALEHYQKILDYQISQKGAKHTEVAIIKGNMGQAYRGLGEGRKYNPKAMTIAQEYTNEAIEKVTAVFGPNERRLIGTLNSMGNIMINFGNYAKVLEGESESTPYLKQAQFYFEKAMVVAKFWGDPREILACSTGFLRLFGTQNNLKEAYIYAQECVSLCYEESVIDSDGPFKEKVIDFKFRLRKELSDTEYLKIEQRALEVIQSVLGRSHKYSLFKKSEIIHLLNDIGNIEDAIKGIAELEADIHKLSASEQEEFLVIGELKVQIYQKEIMKKIENGDKKVEQGYLEEGLRYFEEAQELSVNLGLSNKGVAFEQIFATMSLLSTKYFNAKQFQRAKFFTAEYYRLLCEHSLFGIEHQRTKQVKAILSFLDSQL